MNCSCRAPADRVGDPPNPQGYVERFQYRLARFRIGHQTVGDDVGDPTWRCRRVEVEPEIWMLLLDEARDALGTRHEGADVGVGHTVGTHLVLERMRHGPAVGEIGGGELLEAHAA